MIQTERSKHRIVRQAFGPDAHLVQTGPTRHAPEQVEIRRGTGLLGSGSTFRAALADALAFTSPGVLVRASDMLELAGCEQTGRRSRQTS